MTDTLNLRFSLDRLGLENVDDVVSELTSKSQKAVIHFSE